jgi:hypothetical protein
MLRYADEAQEASSEEEIGPVRSLYIFAELIYCNSRLRVRTHAGY